MTAADPTKTHISRDFTHKSPLVSCHFSPAGRFVFAGSEDQSVVRWDLASGAKSSLEAHESWVHALASTPDGQTLLTGGCDGALIWWPATAEKPVPARRVNAHNGWINAVAVSRDGALVATCGNDRMVRLWSVADGALVQELPGHAKYVYRVAFDPTGRFLVSADITGMLIQWELAIRKEARRLDASQLYKYDVGQGVDYGGVRDLAFSLDGKYLACSGLIEASNPLGAVSNPAVVILDWPSGTPKLLQRPKENTLGVAWGVRFHPSGFLVAVSGGNGGGFLYFWKPDQVNPFTSFNLTNTGRALDLHPDGLRLATAHHDGHLRVCLMAPKPTS